MLCKIELMRGDNNLDLSGAIPHHALYVRVVNTALPITESKVVYRQVIEPMPSESEFATKISLAA